MAAGDKLKQSTDGSSNYFSDELIERMEKRIDYLTSEFIMNGSTGVWAEPFDKDKFQVCVYSSMEELDEAIGPEAVEHINKVLGGVK